jgi:formate dehydrogenase iron-sulfur subunit
MRQTAAKRLDALHQQGMSQARIYGNQEYGGLHALFLITDKPETYSLPSTESAVLPSRNNIPGYLTATVTAVVAAVAGLIAFRRRGESHSSPYPSGEGQGGG